MKTFSVIGYSVLKGVRKVRTANDLAARTLILERNGHTEIELYAVNDFWPGAIVNNKEEAAALLAAHPTLARAVGPIVKTNPELAEIKAWADINASVAATYLPKPEPEVDHAVDDAVDAVDEQPSFEIKEATNKPTFEEVLATVPMRENGRFIKKAVREQMAHDLLAQMA